MLGTQPHTVGATHDISPGSHPKAIHKALGSSNLSRALKTTKGLQEGGREEEGGTCPAWNALSWLFAEAVFRGTLRGGQAGPQQAVRIHRTVQEVKTRTEVWET